MHYLNGYVILGPPLSGKSTLADNLNSLDNHIIKYDSGDEFRDWTQNTEEGKLAADKIKRGEYGSDVTAMQLFDTRCGQLICADKFDPSEDYFALVGLPRTKKQADLLSHMMFLTRRVEVHHLVYLAIPEQSLMGRLEGRIEQRRKEGLPPRPDDNPVIVRERIKRFYDLTEELKSYYGPNKLTEITDPNLGPLDLAKFVHEIFEEKRLLY